MSIPDNLLYTSEHEWIKIDGKIATIGITDFAQSELGDIIFLEFPALNSVFNKGEIFGTIEAVKTVSDLYMPIDGEICEINEICISLLACYFPLYQLIERIPSLNFFKSSLRYFSINKF